MEYINGMRKEVRDLFSVSEGIQRIVAQNEPISEDEVDLVRFCADELLKNVQPLR